MIRMMQCAALVAFAICVESVAIGQDAELADHHETDRVGFVGDERTLSWSPCGAPADWFEIRIVHRETGLLVHSASSLPGDVFEYRWTPTRTGHYWVELRACIRDNPDTPGTEDNWCTAYTDSRAVPTDCDGNPLSDTAYPDGWVYYFKLKPPTDGGIEQ